MIYFDINSLPPSTNSVYMTIRKGKKTIRILTKEGRKYKEETAAWLTTKYPTRLASIKPDVPYTVLYVFTIPDLLTKSWPEKAKNRYRKVDATNRVKLLEDVVAEVTGVDDSSNMTVIIKKVTGPSEKTEVFIYREDDEDNDIELAISRNRRGFGIPPV